MPWCGLTNNDPSIHLARHIVFTRPIHHPARPHTPAGAAGTSRRGGLDTLNTLRGRLENKDLLTMHVSFTASSPCVSVKPFGMEYREDSASFSALHRPSGPGALYRYQRSALLPRPSETCSPENSSWVWGVVLGTLAHSKSRMDKNGSRRLRIPGQASEYIRSREEPQSPSTKETSLIQHEAGEYSCLSLAR